MNDVEEKLTEMFGEKCPDYEIDCACCIMWKSYELGFTRLEDLKKMEHRMYVEDLEDETLMLRQWQRSMVEIIEEMKSIFADNHPVHRLLLSAKIPKLKLVK